MVVTQHASLFWAMVVSAFLGQSAFLGHTSGPSLWAMVVA